MEMKKPKILIVDDHEGFRESLVRSPILTSDYLLFEAETGERALAMVKVKHSFDCIILDYDFKTYQSTNNMSGIEVMQKIKEISSDIPIIMMSGITEGRDSVAIESIRNNALVFLDKPFPISKLKEILNSIFFKDSKKTEDAQKILSDMGFITVSESMQSFAYDVLIAAENHLNVLITGETGTGKTILARIIHKLSKQKNKPFEEQNCGVISRDINSFKSQLFGHTKGAFTGAAKEKKGIFEIAGEGTIFLDDIVTLKEEAQQGLLQAIESKTFKKLGDDRNELQLKARIISATNININKAVEEKLFRKDLKYRISGEIINIPPLRERLEDIPAIVKFYLNNHKEKAIQLKTMGNEALNFLMQQDWPGNVRQLLNVVERAAHHQKNNIILLTTVKEALEKDDELQNNRNEVITEDNIDFIPDNLDEYLDSQRKKIIIFALSQTRGNVSQAAKILGFNHHRKLQYWIEKYKINVRKYK